MANLKITPLDLRDDIRSRIELSDSRKGPWPTGLVVTLFVIALYNLIFYNRYLPVTEGWFSVYAVSILYGEIPYRDFYLLVPPLYPLQIAAFIHFFGQSIIALRVLGIILILSMATIFFLILSRYFSAYVAAFVSIVTIVYYQSGNEHITYDFTQFLTFYALLSAYLLIIGLENTKNHGRPDLKCSVNLFLSGVSAALMVLTKQSNGSLIFIFLIIAIMLPAIALGIRFSLNRVSLFLIGALVPVAIVCAWLYHEGALYFFCHQVFFDAAHAKGSLAVILFSWMKPFLNIDYVYKIGSVCVSIVLLCYVEFILRRSVASRQLSLAKGRHLYFLGIILITCFAIFVPLFDPAFAPMRFGLKLMRNISFASAAAAVVFFLIYLAELGRRETKHIGLFVVSALSMGLIFGNGTSASITQISLFMPLGLLLSYLLSAASFFSSIQVIVIGLSFMLTLTLASNKYAHPYEWWHVAEPDIRTSSVKSNIDGLNGLILSPATANAFSSVTSIIKDNTTTADSIFTFPNIPIFYLLTDRWPKTMAKVHWFDFLSDDQAAMDARLLQNNPPMIIVNLELPEDVWRAHEALFRAGKAMGQRKILRVINDLTTRPGRYRLEASIPIPHECSLKVWRRSE